MDKNIEFTINGTDTKGVIPVTDTSKAKEYFSIGSDILCDIIKKSNIN